MDFPERGFEFEYSSGVGGAAIAPDADCQSADHHFSAGTIVRVLNAAKLYEKSVHYRLKSVYLNSGLPDCKPMFLDNRH